MMNYTRGIIYDCASTKFMQMKENGEEDHLGADVGG